MTELFFPPEIVYTFKYIICLFFIFKLHIFIYNIFSKLMIFFKLYILN